MTLPIMANIKFFASARTQRLQQNKLTLEKHVVISENPEYFTYMDNGVEKKFSGAVIKTEDGKYIGKTLQDYTVDLKYNKKVHAVEAEDSYFSYLDKNNKSHKFIGEPIYNEDSYTYTGIVEMETLSDEVVKIYPQD